MTRQSAAISLAILSAVWVGCHRSSTSPTSPSAAPPTYSLSGIVSEATAGGQAPVDGARVQAADPRLVATTDVNGTYRLSGLSAGTHSVGASKDGYEVARKVVTIDGHAQVDFEIVRLALHSVSGLVFEETPAGTTPVEGAWVSESSPFHAGVWTAANGFYRFSGLYAGPNRFAVSKDGYHTVTKDVTIQGETRVDIPLARR